MAMPFDLPPVFLLPTHLEPDCLHELEGRIPSLTYDIHEADIVLGNISKRERALFELRHRKVQTDPVEVAETAKSHSTIPRKRKSDYASNDSESTTCTEDGEGSGVGNTRSPRMSPAANPAGLKTVKVVKLAWLTESLSLGEALPLDSYVIYEGRKKGAPERQVAVQGSNMPSRAAAEATSPRRNTLPRLMTSSSSQTIHRTAPSLVRQTTSEHDSALKLPPVPSSLRTTYACQRVTPPNPQNAAFIQELKKIRTTRKLMGDQIGVRAYSTSIATISAYPYIVSNPQEVARLPGCGTKISELWHEWKEDGRLREAEDAQANLRLSVIQMFYDIWGVGDTTARDFHNKGWRDLDDVVEYGWDSLTRVQQIGVKFYDEFKLKIPRIEVESIAGTILKHARRFNSGFQLAIVGGYRRGKLESGDVDVVVSHPDESATMNFVEKLVVSLEKSRHITHTLTLSNHNSERGQLPVSWKGNEGRGRGFDTLDKALIVWQEPGNEGLGDSSGDASSDRTHRRPHRRVDIIVSPWKTVGCAVLGWSGDTTFQRDLRRYCRTQKSLKFDSSGIRSRLDGSWADFEGCKRGKAADMLTAERRVFEGLGLAWIRPEDRCTG